MKTFLLWSMLVPGSFTAAAQTTYIIVRIDEAKNANQDKFYKINAEAGNPFASDIYALVTFNTQKGADNSTAAFFAKQNGSTTALYNYFSTPTEALLYLAEKEWQLVSVSTEIISGSTNVPRVGNVEYFPVTTVASRPVYYFKKESNKKPES
jgi:hypothetical protein